MKPETQGMPGLVDPGHAPSYSGSHDRTRIAGISKLGPIPSTDHLDIEICSDPEKFRDLWAELAEDAHASPYQSVEWESAWWRHIANPGGESLKLVSLRREGVLLALLPLASHQARGICVLRFLGGAHFNLQLPLWRDGIFAGVDPVETNLPVERLLRRIGEAAGADVVELLHQPRHWKGLLNPFVPENAEECVSPTFSLPLSHDFPTLSRARRSGRSLQQIRRKRKLLEKAFGKVTFHCARDPQSRKRAIDAVIRQRNARRDLNGIPSFFDTPGAEAFIRDVAGALHGDASFVSPLRIDYLEVDGEIAATYFGTVQSGVYSCFLNSFDAKFANYSPGEIILHDLVEALCAENMVLFDLGVGIEQYKKYWCNPVPLFDVTVPLNSRGKIYTYLKRLQKRAKQTIRHNEKLWDAWKSTRRIMTRGPSSMTSRSNK